MGDTGTQRYNCYQRLILYLVYFKNYCEQEFMLIVIC